jgi:hypothetical protein
VRATRHWVAAASASPAEIRLYDRPFERQGYFCLDRDAAPGRLVFTRTVGLRDSWARVQARGG